MANSENSNRWWENYLVRYFMPSIAGIAILSWFASLDENNQLKQTLFFGNVSGAETLTLTLLILYGNLFCYIASYPILAFHATRVIDFPNAKWNPHILDGYIGSLILAVAVFGVFFIPTCAQIWAAFGLVGLFSLGQFLRLAKALKRKDVQGLGKPIGSLAYGYTFSLAKQRGLQEEKVKHSNQTEDLEEGETLKESEKNIYWRREVMDTYRHLREHGNSAFIFCLEIILAALCYLVLSNTEISEQAKLSRIGILLFIWSLPAVSVHLLGQTFERRFSKFDRRL